MARRSTTPTLSKREQLIAKLDQSRLQINRDASQLGDILNVSRKLEASFHAYRYWWIGGGVLAGLLVAKNLLSPFRSSSASDHEEKPPSDRKGTLFGLLGIAGKQIIRLSKPVLRKAVEKEFEQWFANISKARQEDLDK